MKLKLLGLTAVAGALALAACATTGTNGTPTAASCATATNQLKTATAILNAASAQLPVLQTTAANALAAAGGDKNNKAYADAQVALAIAEATIPGLQAILAGDQEAVTAQCAAVSPAPAS